VDRHSIAEGRASLERAIALHGQGPYLLQTVIASLQVEEQIHGAEAAAPYPWLAALTGSPGTALLVRRLAEP
jgi:RNA polymerase sigma-70 factor (ECF subfamily)